MKGQVHRHGILLLGIEIVMLILFAVFTKYNPDADSTFHPYDLKAHGGKKPEQPVAEDGGHHPTYGMFQDVHVMIFIGFGFLMTFLKRYGFGSVGFNFLIAAVALQWAVLVNGFFHLHHGYIEINMSSLLGADFVAACVLISFGVLLGKTTPTQLVIMTIIEIPIFVVNEVIGRKFLGAVDMGDSMFVHAFGAYFGLAVSRVIARDEPSTEKEGSTKTSDMFAMIGSIFLWLYWPSFNAGGASGDDQNRAIINTYLALTASCVMAYAVSALVDPENKFDMVHVQNSTLAGGVAIGTSADMMATPAGSIAIGLIAGLVSVLGYTYLTPLLASKLRIHDTCGVHNLHGMPAIIAGICGAIYCAVATEETYGPGLYSIFPMRAPVNQSEDFFRLEEFLNKMEVDPSEGRTGGQQAGFQLAALVVTIVISLVGGALTGLVLRMGGLNSLDTEELYEDLGYWKVEEEEISPLNTSFLETKAEQSA